MSMGRVAFLFPGQGAQIVGMGKDLFLHCDEARRLYDRARDVLGWDVARLCFDGPADQMSTTTYSQPCIYVTSLAAMAGLRQTRSDVAAACDVTGGLSLGEYTALTFAGAIAFEDGLRLVYRRGQLMQAASDATPGGMVAVVGIEVDRVESLCREASTDGEVVRVANLNCPGQVVVSGTHEACRRVRSLAEHAGALKAVPLDVAGAFHSPLMSPADTRLGDELRSVPIDAPRIPVIANVDADYHADPDAIRRRLVRQVVEPVLWERCMRRLLDEGVDRVYEIGPGRVLTGLLKRIDRRVRCESICAMAA